MWWSCPRPPSGWRRQGPGGEDCPRPPVVLPHPEPPPPPLRKPLPAPDRIRRSWPEAAGGGTSSFSSAAGAGAATACCTGSAPAASATTGDAGSTNLSPASSACGPDAPGGGNTLSSSAWAVATSELVFLIGVAVRAVGAGGGATSVEGWAGDESWAFGPIGGGSSTSLTAAAPDAPSGSLTEYCSSGEVDLLRPRRRPSTIVSSIGQDSRCSSSPAPKIRSSLSTKMFHVEPSTEALSPSSGQRPVHFVGLNVGPTMDAADERLALRWHPDRDSDERVPVELLGGSIAGPPETNEDPGSLRLTALRSARSGSGGPSGTEPGWPLLLSANRRPRTETHRWSPTSPTGELLRPRARRHRGRSARGIAAIGWVPDTYFAGPCGPSSGRTHARRKPPLQLGPGQSHNQ